MANNFSRVVERFLRYVKVDTQSQEEVEAYPSTEKQKDLGNILLAELKDLGLKDVQMNEYGYVTATIPATIKARLNEVPTIGFIAHLDTAPNVSGKDVKAMIHKNYSGGDIELTNGVIIREKDHPELKNQIGNDIITSDGTTLLGADDKAGIAAIMEMAERLIKDRSFLHGNIRIAFTLDEEVGRGVDFFDKDAFGADFAYTVDGETVGEVENETFCADGAKITIRGVDIHPGFAKGRMINSLKIASEIIGLLPSNMAPETTEGKEGYIHPMHLSGSVENTEITFILRDFEEAGLKEQAELLMSIVKAMRQKYPEAEIGLKIKKQYRNMRYELDQHPEVVEYALEAVRRTGIESKLKSIRGGTDGARLTLEGLPTPNIFHGGHAFHSREEWISVQDMEKAVEVLINIVQIASERLSLARPI